MSSKINLLQPVNGLQNLYKREPLTEEKKTLAPAQGSSARVFETNALGQIPFTYLNSVEVARSSRVALRWNFLTHSSQICKMQMASMGYGSLRSSDNREIQREYARVCRILNNQLQGVCKVDNVVLKAPNNLSVLTSAFLSKERVAVGLSDTTFLIYDISNPYNPVNPSRVASKWDISTLVTLDQDTILSTNKTGLVVIANIADPSNPLKKFFVEHLGNGAPALTSLSRGVVASSVTTDRLTKISIWNCENPHELIAQISLRGETETIGALLSLSGALIATGSSKGNIKFWDISNPRATVCLNTLPAHSKGVRVLIQLAKGRIASGFEDGTVKIWDILNREKPRLVATLPKQLGRIDAIGALSDGRILSISGNNLQICDFSVS